ncbi:MAG: hypothetical protein PHR47_02580 [Candidatus Pacebacteria bacterium]|nr:hypothetical protein [Candidatus Paceibacterota bacterium]
MISEEALKEFKSIYKKEFSIDLSNKDALESATKLLTLVKAVYKPMTKEEYEKIQKRREETKG